MKHAIAALLVVGAATLLAAHQQQQPAQSTSPLTPEQQAIVSKMPTMNEDKRVKAEEIDSLMASGKVFFLDVREPKEIEELGSYEGYVNIPVTQLEKRLGELPKDKLILTA
jgi:hypothetical protein